MSDQKNIPGWNSIDEESVPVRIEPKAKPSTPVRIVAEEPIERVTAFEKRPETSVQPNPGAMRFSALLGIAIVVIGGTMILGVDSLRGSLTESGSGLSRTVTITEDNHFDPASIDIPAGSTLVLENKNKDPQVVKVKSGSELFPVQVLFDKPYSFVVPAGTNGTYVYTSETLPGSETLTINVTPAIETNAVASSAQSSASSAAAFDIPIPFGNPNDIVQPQNSASSEQTAPSISVTPTETQAAPMRTSDTTEVFSVGDTQASSEPASFSSGTIPENPYTVANAKKTSGIANSAKKLHSGAPLLDSPQYRPRVNAETGSEVWFVILGAFSIVLFGYRAKRIA